jgi:uncharacterized protein YciI
MTELHQYLYRLKPTRKELLSEGPTEAEHKTISLHHKYLVDFKEDGIVLFAGRTLNTDDTSFGIVFYLADSEESANQIMRNDPAVNMQVMIADFFPFRIAMVGNVIDG